MKIIIVGAGEVGRHVAKMLSNENHEILIMDSDEEHLQDLDSNYDMLTHQGSPTSIKDLMLCGVKDCDLFIAVTPEESININSGILASQLGAKKILARINNYEYLLPKNKEIFKALGIDILVYPEMLAASEIVQSLRRNWIREYRTFCNEALILVCIKVRNNACIINKQFKSGFFNHEKYRIVAIKRHNETIIPGGNDEILANDLVYFICAKTNLEFVKEDAGKTYFDIKNIIIMGGSSIALKTVQYLPSHINVKIIESDKNKCYELADRTTHISSRPNP